MEKLIGKIVEGIIDRPLGTHHPKYSDMIYEVNYGYVPGIISGDGEELDAYILGSNLPLERFKGKVIGIYHRFNDVEDKLIVSTDDKVYSDEEILNLIYFQEKYFTGELIR